MDRDPDAADVGSTLEGALSAEVVVGCPTLDPSLRFYQQLGFTLELISPADAPTTAVVAGFGIRLRLDSDPSRRERTSGSVRLRLAADAATADRLGPTVTAPEGTVVDIAVPRLEPDLPPASPGFELSRFDPSDFGTGRASMTYRDLLPSRQGGRYIASHIRIAEGGPVPDYVHYHRILFQMIYCRRGWVRVVYEDQGPPFVLEPGDCVLQPPGIRHRVLEASDGLEVVEVGCPAIHDTCTDPGLLLPNDVLAPDRLFGGQHFVRHVAADAVVAPSDDGFIARNLGFDEATGGLASLRTVRSNGRVATALQAPAGSDLYFLFIDHGRATLRGPEGLTVELRPGDAVALPTSSGVANEVFRVDGCSNQFEAVELIVRDPASV